MLDSLRNTLRSTFLELDSENNVLDLQLHAESSITTEHGHPSSTQHDLDVRPTIDVVLEVSHAL